MQTIEYELRDRIDQLANYRGEGTELITVAVLPDKSLGQSVSASTAN